MIFLKRGLPLKVSEQLILLQVGCTTLDLHVFTVGLSEDDCDEGLRLLFGSSLSGLLRRLNPELCLTSLEICFYFCF